MNAIITNTITAILLTISVFCYFIYALIAWLKEDPRFNGLFVIFFLSIFLFILVSVWAHYSCWNIHYRCFMRVWLCIALGVVFINYCAVYLVEMPNFFRHGIVTISLMLVWFQFMFNLYEFTALSLLLTTLIAGIYSRGLTRVGFFGLVFTNILWILIQVSVPLFLGHRLVPQNDYANDVYHILELVFIFILFWSVVKGQWSYPKIHNT
jgi:hypothetical protein